MKSIGTSTHFCTLLGYTWTGALRPVLKILVLFSQYVLWKVNEWSSSDTCVLPSAYFFCYLWNVGIISVPKLVLFCVEWKHCKEDKNLSFKIYPSASLMFWPDMQERICESASKLEGRVLSFKQQMGKTNEAKHMRENQ